MTMRITETSPGNFAVEMPIEYTDGRTVRVTWEDDSYWYARIDDLRHSVIGTSPNSPTEALLDFVLALACTMDTLDGLLASSEARLKVAEAEAKLRKLDRASLPVSCEEGAYPDGTKCWIATHPDTELIGYGATPNVAMRMLAEARELGAQLDAEGL